MDKYKIGIIGCGYVGLITGVCFAELGNKVICHDIDKEKIVKLKQGIVPFFELGLAKMFTKNKNRLSFTISVEEVIENSDYIFICVGSPSRNNGEADTTSLFRVIDQINSYVKTYKMIIIKSTVPVGTAKKVKELLKEKIEQDLIEVISNPEFLREGNAIYDFMNPDRIVIGADSFKKAKNVARLYQTFSCPILLVSNEDAELIKYASNNFLAMKISFINEIANICERVGADISKVSYGIGLDHRIGNNYLQAGLGFGGPCLTKDLKAMIAFCKRVITYEPHLLKAVLKVNELQPELVIKKVKEVLGNLEGKRIGILGLSFKPGTDDMRNAPALKLITSLVKEGTELIAYDPKANKVAKELLKDQIEFAKEPYQVSYQSYALIIVTEWKEFLDLDYEKIKSYMIKPILVDGRNMFDNDRIQKLKKMGFQYFGVGRNLL
ncbi:hypothetical protein BBF96_00520 [Anoxybacter fermentans]|uniref:UDP-glucose 6-dehydrogenase n=1 Tax=Anoxybacter fermentans TaxID=1323375 RepID=A0A3Q9HNQ5_9FIRM|nr:UDP-glucose/GDP-mannose dehydrogenase family protein [Anoxybacter fermentans]AZR72020.1 hypothetical protein BBF96_00520 [Anoxybacter fermentans]